MPARILVVDDDSRVAATLERVLNAEGHVVEVAVDGPAALAAADEVLASNDEDAVAVLIETLLGTR